MNKYIATFSVIATLAISLISCNINEPGQQYINEDQVKKIVGNGLLLNLNDLKRAPYMTEKGNYCDPALYRLRASGKGHTKDVSYLDTIWLFSIDTIPTGRPLYIRGRITTDDFSGNFYKTLCIQQMVGGRQQALRISVDAGSVGGLYQIGQELLIRIDGLAIGRYANQPQLCVASYNNNIYANKAEEKVGWAPGRIPFSEFNKRVTLIGKPQTPYCDTIEIFDFINHLNQVENRFDDGRLVCIKNVYYTGQYSNYGDPANCTTNDPDDFENGSSANVFAPSTGNMNFPQSRIITDEEGYMTLVSASEYAKFSHFYLPGANENGIAGCQDYVGNVTGILGYYRDNNITKLYNNVDSNAPAWDDWSITIRSLDDLQLFDEDGNLWERREYRRK